MIAVYRCLYGEDFVAESVHSILPHVDRVVFVLAPRPWGTSTSIEWKGKRIEWPANFDNLRERVSQLGWETSETVHLDTSYVPHFRAEKLKIFLVDDFFPSPFGQYQHIVNNILAPRGYLPDDVVFVEPDHVFTAEAAEATFVEWHASKAPAAYTSQVELWAPPGHKPVWRVPERPGRASVEFHRDVRLGGHLAAPRLQLEGTVHNLGFCFSAKTMLWKHLTAMAFAKEIGDTPPDPDWYEKKWLAWHPETNNQDLEIGLGLGYKIPKVVPYDGSLLPESIKRRYGL